MYQAQCEAVSYVLDSLTFSELVFVLVLLLSSPWKSKAVKQNFTAAPTKLVRNVKVLRFLLSVQIPADHFISNNEKDFALRHQ